ncbi:MAG: hypothetical protein KAY65_07775 [Planctomycetes bacterium]|nr:hypothetical protein [Planctomycetota bacterium]
MTRMHLMARLTLTMLGVFIFIESVSYFWLMGSPKDTWWPTFYVFGIFLLLSFLACRMLFWSDAWMERMIGAEDEDAHLASSMAAVGGFRVVLVLCGLLILGCRIEILVRAAAFIVVAPKIIVNMIVYKHVDKVFYMAVSTWVRLIVNLCKTALGIYLVLGAPRFVRWQMDKYYLASSED